MRRRLRGLACAALLAFVGAGAHGAGTAPAGSPVEGVSPEVRDRIERVGTSAFRIGLVTVDAASRTIAFPAEVNMATGLVEVVACTLTGKRHESILASPVLPFDLHLACLLLGLRPGRNPAWYVPENPAHRPPGWDRPAGDRVRIAAAWSAAGATREVPLEQMLMDVRTGDPLEQSAWVFVGSYLDPHGGYVADDVGSLVTNYHDRSTVIDLPLEGGRLDDYIFVNYRVVPPAGTAVEVRVFPAENNRKENAQ